jgi:anti-anti-sigma factor
LAELEFSMEPHGASVVASVRGELDVTSSDRFDDFLTEAAARSDRVILDLSGVDFMDTTALAVIVAHWRRQVAVGGVFFLAGARYRYTKALWITGLADRLPRYDTVADAIADARPEVSQPEASQPEAGRPEASEPGAGRPEPGAGTASGPDARKSGGPEATAD